MATLTAEDRETLVERGYLVVPDVVPRAMCARVIEAIRAFLAIDTEDSASWYRRKIGGHGIVPLHHAQALWDLRQLPSVHEIFAEIYGTERLWVTMDRVSFKAPAKGWDEPVTLAPVHWDVDPRTLKELRVQGLVYLTDTDAAQGAFACVPGLYHGLEAWLREHAEDENIRRPDASGHELVPIGAPAGSLVLWHRLMPHTSTENRGDAPRFVQYVTMDPVGSTEDREIRARDFLEKHPPAWALRQNVPGQLDPEPGEPAVLTSLGRRLVGLEDW